MSASLIRDMEARAVAMRERAAGFRLAGDRQLGTLAHRASCALMLAIDRLVEFDEVEGEAKSRDAEA